MYKENDKGIGKDKDKKETNTEGGGKQETEATSRALIIDDWL